MLSPEQVKSIKEQLLSQIEKANIPNKEEVKNSINAMDAEQLEAFLKQNKLIQEGGEQGKCIFCSILEGQIPSYKIDEDADAIAILEINPVSKGHTLIIPKKHLEKAPKEINKFAEKVAKKLKKLKPKKIDVIPSSLFGHGILNILPVYKDETLESPKQKAPENELLKLQKLLAKNPKPKLVKKPKTQKLKPEKLWLPKRIP